MDACRESAVCADVGFKSTVHGKAAQIAVVGGKQGRPFVVLFGPDGLRHKRIAAIRSNHDLGPLGHGLITLEPAPDADDDAVFDQDLVHGEVLSNFRSGLNRCVNQQFVDHRPPGAVGDWSAVAPGDPEIVNGPKSNE